MKLYPTGAGSGRVSSGLTSRPSLSDAASPLGGQYRPSVVGINLPTFVERPPPPAGTQPRSSVVGINLPTFVERAAACGRGTARAWGVVGINLPTFVERTPPQRPQQSPPRVVGINLPTFVERRQTREDSSRVWRVSSGLTSRPSLSVGRALDAAKPGPSVVGINLPTFVERALAPWPHPSDPCVVGINLPTFVERVNRATRTRLHRCVSSGLTSRPSLSGIRTLASPLRAAPCRRD